MQKIGIVSPCGFLTPKHKENLEIGIKYLESLGYKVELGKHVFDQYLFMAGTDKNRASDIMKFYKDKNVVAIIAAKGGIGGARVLEHLDFDIIKNNKKPFIGFSDITSIQNAIYKKTKQPSIHGFMACHNFSKGKIKQNSKLSFNALLNNKSLEITSGTSVIEGKAEGILIGGNLIVFATLFGTEYMPDLANKIIFLEDIDEWTYAINRTLVHLKQQKNFNKIKGIVFGNFNNCNHYKNRPEDGDLDTQINDFALGLNIPIIKDFEVGHMHNGYAVPIGRKVKITSSKNGCKLHVD